MAVVLKGYGLSLSDHYWVKPEETDIQWEQINFFDNTSDGWLKKRWKISIRLNLQELKIIKVAEKGK